MLLWIAVSALATEDAIQVRAFPGAVAFAEAHAEALDPSWAYDDLYAEAVSCYDVVGIRDFNLSVPIDEVSLTLGPDTLTVQVDFGLIRGEDMNLYSYDSEWTDLCAEFDTTIYYAQISGASVTAPLEIAPPGFADLFSGTDLSFQWAEPPELTGDIETDIAWVPDSLVLFFIEDALREAALDALTETLPPLLGALLGEAAYAGDYGGLAAALDLTDATLESDSLSLYVDASLAATSSETCEIGAAGSGPPPTGLAQARLPLDAADDADLGVGLTEALMGEGLHAAWEAGWFCVEADSVRELLDGLALCLDAAVEDVEPEVTVEALQDLRGAFGRRERGPALGGRVGGRVGPHLLCGQQQALYGCTRCYLPCMLTR